MIKISLIHPSRNRPEKARANYHTWLRQSSKCHEIEYILSLDVDEPQSLWYTEYFNASGIKLAMSNPPDGYVVGATNEGAKLATGDILVYLSDDFGCPQDWDKLIVERMDITKPQILKVDDCLQQFNVGVLTIPIMTKAYYDQYGYFFYPEYKSMFCDEDLYNVAKMKDQLVFAPEFRFPHMHPSNPDKTLCGANDETYNRSAGMWNQGKEVLRKRKACNYAR